MSEDTMQKTTDTLGSMLLETPFRINKRLKNGDLADWTTYWVEKRFKREPLDSNRNIRIYFHDLKQWINPPTDTNMEDRIIKRIEKYGVVYLEEGDEL